MQQSSMVLFCDECGLANKATASHCVSCQHSLAHQSQDSERDASPIAPITFTPKPVLEVCAGAALDLEDQESFAPVTASNTLTCDFRPDSVLAGRYQVQEEIGRGGFSTVYRALDLKAGPDQRLVAIKRIQLDKLSSREAIDATETFYREIAMLARVKNLSGIPTYCEHLTDAENWYLVTQYIEGQTLEEYLQKAPGGYLDEKEVIALGLKLASLLHTLHITAPPVIFRDLKPANIMLTPNNKIFLIDFGIARTFTRDKARDTVPLGSPGYAPPEQYGRAQTSPRSDIYSLGATLQTLLTGRDPLELAEGEPSRNPRPISPRFRKLLDKMLSTEPSRRPKDMERVRLYLENNPTMFFLMGMVYGGTYSLLALLNLFLPVDWRAWVGFIWLGIAKSVESIIRSNLKLPDKNPKGMKRYWWLGLLTWSLLLLVFFWLGHIFFGWAF
ncbi:protein kinase domain-containing protein [Ktedonobacter robiniae]|uniref:non-specific serine/threonine protein kinase n=1 Tax=Ktedonobacter robiniae TaxID=2778365 RepID=A0ABQ3UWL5_9CHLR|nr:protein kinase [Ktedonobacter robiniae]GHO56795.1 hypothetical protein KSB_52700 [Ktedonobacter robiniae]